MMLREEDLAGLDAEVRRNGAAHPHLLAERAFHRRWKRSPGMREGAKRARQDPIELQHRPLVEDDRIEFARLETAPLETPLDGLQRKRRVVLSSRETLLLYGAHRHAVDDQCCGRIVIVRGDAEDVHVVRISTAWTARPAFLVRRWSNRPALADPRAWPATQTAASARSTAR